MGKITLILGGARSGKSRLAVKMAKEKGKKVAFIATCRPMDKEMERRITLHKKARPTQWHSYQESEDLHLLLKRIGDEFNVIIIDCLTILVSNLLLKGFKEKDIERSINQMVSVLKKIKANIIIVSNEVGSGIVPDNKLAREFRDIAGKTNQIVAKNSNEVFFMVSGLPVKIKGVNYLKLNNE